VSEKLVPYQPEESLELFQGHFMVPSNWTSCGPVIHISGGPGLRGGQPIAMALTKNALALCSKQGPKYSIPLGSIKEVKVQDLSGMSIPVVTPSGIKNMVPQIAKGVSISYLLSPMGTISRVVTFTLTPNTAYEWEHEIMTAIHENVSRMDDSAQISRR
jgi:hypothetical protein